MDERREERRKHPRVKAGLALEIGDQGSIIESWVENISCSGVYCQTEKPIPLMTRVAVCLFFPCPGAQKVDFDRIECRGVVARSQPIVRRDKMLYSTAIYFTEITKKDKNRIADFILRNL